MTSTETDERAAFLTRLRAFEGLEVDVEVGADPVNQPMIRHWVEAMGDENPIYVDPDAAAHSVHGEVIPPPVMLQAWVMRGIKPRPASGGSPRDELMRLLDEAGFSSVVATNCEQEYDRMLHLGDHLQTRTVIDSVSEEKQTGLGIGHFVTTRVEYETVDGESVARMLFRILKFRPGTGRSAAPLPPRSPPRRLRAGPARRSPPTARSGSRARRSTGSSSSGAAAGGCGTPRGRAAPSAAPMTGTRKRRAVGAACTASS